LPRSRTPWMLASLTAVVLAVAGCGGTDDAAEGPDVADTPDETTEDGDDTAADEPTTDERLDELREGIDERSLGGGADGDAGDDAVVEDLDAAARRAVEDLAEAEGVDPADIEVVVAERVTWRDGSLGCPRPGEMYTQALQPGYRIVLSLDGEEIAYHGREGLEARRCDDPQPPAPGGGAS
jgi:hypothetical protein